MDLRTYKKIELSKIKPFGKNSRKHSRAQIKEVEHSIARFGFTNPVLLDEDYTILAGHCRVQAAKNLNFPEIPCIIINGLSETEKRAYIIADNKLALNADWDMDLLKTEVNYLLDAGFDINLTGFSNDEIADLFSDSGKPELDVSDSTKSNKADKTVTCPGCELEFTPD